MILTGGDSAGVQLVHHEPHVDRPGIEPVLHSNRLNHGADRRVITCSVMVRVLSVEILVLQPEHSFLEEI